MSYITAYYHIVFTTRNREAVITPSHKNDLCAVIASIINKRQSKALVVNGVENHVHILLNLHQTIALADMMREIKSRSSVWMKESKLFPMFGGWEQEYGAFSISESHKQAVFDYIINQEIHHQKNSLENEFHRLVMKNGLTFYPWR